MATFSVLGGSRRVRDQPRLCMSSRPELVSPCFESLAVGGDVVHIRKLLYPNAG